MEEMQNYRELILENIEYDYLRSQFATYREDLDELRRLRGYPCTPTKIVHPLARLYYFCGFYYPIREVIPIAIYHCNIGIVSRGKGKSAVAAAAYRSGEKITNEWDGMTHDYTRKRGVVHTEILLPPHPHRIIQRGTDPARPGILFLSICFQRNVR